MYTYFKFYWPGLPPLRLWNFSNISSFPSYSNISSNQLKLPENQKYELSVLGNWIKKNCHLPTPSAIPTLEKMLHGKFSSRKLAFRKMFWITAPWKITSWWSINHGNCPSYIFWKFYANIFLRNVEFLFSCIILNQ